MKLELVVLVAMVLVTIGSASMLPTMIDCSVTIQINNPNCSCDETDTVFTNCSLDTYTYEYQRMETAVGNNQKQCIYSVTLETNMSTSDNNTTRGYNTTYEEQNCSTTVRRISTLNT